MTADADAWDGVPDEPHRMRCHLVVHPHDNDPMALYWNLSNWLMPGSSRLYSPREMGKYRYLGPCRTNAELAAVEARTLERVVGVCGGDFDSEMQSYGRAFAEMIHALPREQPGKPALDAMLAAAKAEGLEEAAQIALTREEGEPGHTWAAWPDGHEIAEAIRYYARAIALATQPAATASEGDAT